MENIVQAVEAAVTRAEEVAKADAHKVVVEAKQIDAACEHAWACIKCALVLPVVPAIPLRTVTTQAQKEAEEDARAIEGSFVRFVRRIWAWL
jgi:hypothetical protein